jgi:type I restriction enzyme S subunit
MHPYLRVANVLEDALDLADVMEMDFPGDHYQRYRLAPGDILLNEGQTPDLVGRPAMFRGELPDVCFAKTLLRFRPGPEVDGEFALLVFLRHLHAGRFRREARITTNIGHMVLARFKTVDFPVPPRDEQRQIVTNVREQLSALGRARKGLEVAQKRARLLRGSILDTAFSGDLLPQNPSDEPAQLRAMGEERHPHE